MKLNTGNEMPPQLGGKRPKFNIYWVWAAVAVVILSWGLLGSGEVTHPTHIFARIGHWERFLGM